MAKTKYPAGVATSEDMQHGYELWGLDGCVWDKRGWWTDWSRKRKITYRVCNAESKKAIKRKKDGHLECFEA